MEYSAYGALAQMFIVDSITQRANAVAGTDLKELADKWGDNLIRPQAWHGVAKEIKQKFDRFYNRHADPARVD